MNTQSALETAFLQQSKALVDLAKGQQATIREMQETIDRVVATRYDRAVEKVAPPAQAVFPGFEPDQGEVRPALEAESDAEFLESVGVK